jgi:copper chaperone CopZ
MKTITLYLKGMHCNACKLLVEKSLIQLPEIQAVDANVRKGHVRLQYKGELNLEEITHIIRECGYEIVDEPVARPWLSKQIKDYKIAILSLIFFLLMYFILKETGLFTGEIMSVATPSLGLVLLIGLTAGFSSCMAVVGGLVLAISSKRNQGKEEQTFGQKIIPHFWFNAGRIVGFSLLGGILGALGQGVISLSPFVMSVMIFIVGIVMLLLGVNLSQLSPKLSGFVLSMPLSLRFLFSNSSKKKMRW